MFCTRSKYTNDYHSITQICELVRHADSELIICIKPTYNPTPPDASMVTATPKSTSTLIGTPADNMVTPTAAAQIAAPATLDSQEADAPIRAATPKSPTTPPSAQSCWA